MISLLISATVSFLAAVALTPIGIRKLRRLEIGQFIHWDREGHAHKQGTPTMGGLVVIAAVTIGYLASHIRIWTPDAGFGLSIRTFEVSGGMVLLAFVGMGCIGLVDDYWKYRREHYEGLTKRWKFLGQLVVAALFAWAAVAAGVSTELAFTRGLGFDLGPFYFLLVLLMLTATANAVNLTDGLDGLAAGASALIFGAFVIISFWQLRQLDRAFYDVDEPLGLAVIAAALLGASLGFLWFNAAPAKIFMGDTGSQALGGAVAALALLTNTHLLLVIMGGLFVMETLSVIMQVASFRLTGKRIFLTAPIHHHFERLGWPEFTVIVRFWILAGIAVALALGVFYGDFITSVELE